MIDDCEGILLTGWAGSKALARKSCIEFGWAVGRPENTRTEAYMHAKYVPEGRSAGSGSEQNLGQNIFHRPASSGQYAVSYTHLDVYKRQPLDQRKDLASYPGAGGAAGRLHNPDHDHQRSNPSQKVDPQLWQRSQDPGAAGPGK